MLSRLAIKVDVDTDRGTRDGVLPIAKICQRCRVPATVLFSLGPDNMGKSIYRLFQPGFLKKVWRTGVISNYGLRALLNGTLLPPPHLGWRHGQVMRQVRDLGFEVGIHCYDHYLWQNKVHRWTPARVRSEFTRAVKEFQRIFGEPPQTAGAPGWQCNAAYLATLD
jgi:peptidoglycan/xylan/chitin deacetylase (PgdA/CDA1 family)